MMRPEPGPGNRFLEDHVARLCFSYRHWTGEDLIDAASDPVTTARALYHAAFVVVSHDTGNDPRFNYANLSAQCLFAMDWDTFVQTPSRLSAEATVQAERRRLLSQVGRHGYARDYRGVRVTRDGRRFIIEGAVVWNVVDAAGRFYGQAARIDRWRFLDDERTSSLDR